MPLLFSGRIVYRYIVKIHIVAFYIFFYLAETSEDGLTVTYTLDRSHAAEPITFFFTNLCRKPFSLRRKRDGGYRRIAGRNVLKPFWLILNFGKMRRWTLPNSGRSVEEPAGYELTRGGEGCRYYVLEWGGTCDLKKIKSEI